jgi:hypothetical protein
MTPDDVRKLRQLGEEAALTGTPSFDDIPGIEHSEEARAEYEKVLSGHGRRAKTRGTLKLPRGAVEAKRKMRRQPSRQRLLLDS